MCRAGSVTSQAHRRGRFDRWDGAFVIICMVAFVMITIWGAGFSFWHDDWLFLDTHSGDGAAALIVTALLSWYGLMPRRRPVNALPLLVVSLWATSANGVHLRWFAEEWVPERMDKTRATYGIIVEHGGSELVRELEAELLDQVGG